MHRSQKPEKPSLTRLSTRLSPGLNAILDGGVGDEIEATLAEISAVGHSSGFDAFSGVLAVTEAWQRKRGADSYQNCA